MIEKIGFDANPYLSPRYLTNLNQGAAMEGKQIRPETVKVSQSDGEGIISDRMLKRQGVKDCETCKNRKYQDGSDDPGVSMKAPTHLNPQDAASAVSAHEQEHVVREQAKAAEEGREVVMQTVAIHTDVCPECGRLYVSGGVTQTVTRKKPYYEFEEQRGKLFNAYA